MPTVTQLIPIYHFEQHEFPSSHVRLPQDKERGAEMTCLAGALLNKRIYQNQEGAAFAGRPLPAPFSAHSPCRQEGGNEVVPRLVGRDHIDPLGDKGRWLRLIVGSGQRKYGEN